jgi:hypothetical protein
LLYTPDGTAATLTADGDPNKQVTVHGDSVKGLHGGEVLSVDNITPATGKVLVGVVVTETDSGNTTNAVETATGAGVFESTMPEADVNVQVVFQDENDPLGDMYIATVTKVNDDGYANNNATILNQTVNVPATNKGDIWTGAYEGNEILVHTTTELGYYVDSVVMVRLDKAEGDPDQKTEL